MKISVSKKEIFDEVEKRTSLEGFVLPERYDGVWANADRGALLDSYWVEGCEAVVQLLKRYITSSTVTHVLNVYNGDETLTLEATMPGRFNTLLEGSIATDVKMLIACNVLCRWLEVTLPEASAKYKDESLGYSEALRVKLLYRDAPTTTVVDSKNDTENVAPESVSLSSAKDDSVSVHSDVAALKKGTVDDMALPCSCSNSLIYAEGDNEQMTQEWNKRVG